MGERTGIAWCDHTFNPWWGCQAVSEACRYCYAESFAERVGHGKRLPQIWGGASTERKFFGDKHWNEPLKWDRAAKLAGVRRRVFSASMADVFEDRSDLYAARARLHAIIARTHSLDWLLLTKRPENADRLWREAHIEAYDGSESMGPTWGSNVWLGTTCESQAEAEKRIPHLAAVPARIRFVSYEPALEAVSFREWLWDIHWIIVGGESGPHARPFSLAWADNVVGECRATGRAPFIKQLGSVWARDRVGRQPHGADPSEWPSHLRVQEFPT